MRGYKYQSSMPSSFREEKFLNGLLCSYVPSCDPGAGPILTQGHHMNKIGRGPQGDAIYQVSKLNAFQFQRRILKLAVFVSMFQLVTPGARSVLTPGV